LASCEAIEKRNEIEKRKEMQAVAEAAAVAEMVASVKQLTSRTWTAEEESIREYVDREKVLYFLQ
jgi:hypothetical protein